PPRPPRCSGMRQVGGVAEPSLGLPSAFTSRRPTVEGGPPKHDDRNHDKFDDAHHDCNGRCHRVIDLLAKRSVSHKRHYPGASHRVTDKRGRGEEAKGETKVRMNVVARPGANKGSRIRRNRWNQLAPRVVAAASREGSIPDR